MLGELGKEYSMKRGTTLPRYKDGILKRHDAMMTSITSENKTHDWELGRLYDIKR